MVKVNTPIAAPDIVTLLTNATASSNITAAVANCQGVIFTVTGTFSATLTPQYSPDGGATWSGIEVVQLGGASGAATTITAAGVYVAAIPSSPVGLVQLPLSSYVSGNATAVVTPTNLPVPGIGGGGGSSNVTVVGALPAGTNAIGTVSSTALAATIPTDVQFFTAQAGNVTGTPAACTGYAGIVIEVTASVAMTGGTAVAFLGNRQASGGTFYPIAATLIAGTGAGGTSTSTVGIYYIPLGGFRQVRADITGYSAGSGIAANGTLYPTAQPVLASQVSLSSLISGEDQTLNRTMVSEEASYTNITTQATTVVKSGAGTLYKVIINKAVATGVITIYDNTAGSGTVIATITQPAAVLSTSYVLPYGIKFSTGLTVVTGTASQDITVCWL